MENGHLSSLACVLNRPTPPYQDVKWHLSKADVFQSNVALCEIKIEHLSPYQDNGSGDSWVSSPARDSS